MANLADHYAAVRAEFDYEPVDVDVGPLPGSYLKRSFAATDDPESLSRAGDCETLFTASAGMTGAPHVGTLAQLFAVKRFEEAGFDAQFLVADYEKYAGNGRDLTVVRELAADYVEFVRELGFEGRVRTQYDDRDVMHTAFRLARWDSEDMWPEGSVDTAFERELEAAYDAHQVDHDDADTEHTTQFARELTGLLCAADFVHPLVEEGYDQSVFVLGIDEHELTLANRNALDLTPFSGRLVGLYTRIVPGLHGVPKMSKTIPASHVTMAMDPAEVERRIRAADDEDDGPEESAVYRMMCMASDYSPTRLGELREACARGGEEWTAARAEYAEFLADLARKWPGNGE